jgi:hypothetical protein
MQVMTRVGSAPLFAAMLIAGSTFATPPLGTEVNHER